VAFTAAIGSGMQAVKELTDSLIAAGTPIKQAADNFTQTSASLQGLAAATLPMRMVLGDTLPANGLARPQVIAALAAGGLEAVEQLLIGDGFECLAERGEGGAVVQFAPGEERLADMDTHEAPPCTKGERSQRRGKPVQRVGR
jgi:hypothetical protein